MTDLRMTSTMDVPQLRAVLVATRRRIAVLEAGGPVTPPPRTDAERAQFAADLRALEAELVSLVARKKANPGGAS